MRVVWTEGAVDDLASIVSYIKENDSKAALRVAKAIFDGIMLLQSMPYRGRKRANDDSRELIFAPWPYLAVYEVVRDAVYVKAVRHTARDWSM